MGEKDLSAASAGGMHPWARPTTVKAGEFEDRKDDKRLSLNCLVLMRLRLNRPLMLAAISMDGGGKILRRWSLKAAYALFGDEISDQKSYAASVKWSWNLYGFPPIFSMPLYNGANRL